MAATIETLQLLISANASQFQGELGKINQSLNGLNQSTNAVGASVSQNIFGPMLQANIVGNIVYGTISRLTTGLGDFASSAIAGGSALSRLRVANSVVTANMGLTREQVQGLRDDLKEANTVGIAAEEVISSLALSGLVKLANGLEYVDARTGDTAKGVTALTLAIKDLAAARGLDSVEGIERISKFIQSGRTELVDGLIEIGEINREYGAEATKLGRKSAESLTALERANVRLNIVMREGSKTFGAYAATYNSSGKIFSSTKMLLQSISAEIGANLEPILRVGSLAFLEFFRGISDAVTGSAGAIQDFANRVAGYMVAVIRIIGKLGSNLPLIGAGFRRLADFTLSPIKSQGNLAKSVGGTTKQIDEQTKSAKKLEKELLGLAGFDELNDISKSGGSGGAGDGGAAGAGPALGGGDLGGNTGGFLDTTKEIMEYAKQAETSIDNMLKPFKELWETLSKIQIFGTPVTEILKDIIKYAGIGLIVFKGLSLVLGILGAVISALSSPIILVALAIAALVALFVAAYENSEEFRQFVDGLAATIKDVLVVAWEALSKAVDWAWNNVIMPAVKWFQENIVPVLIEIAQKAKEMAAIFAEKWPAIQKAIQPLAEAIGHLLADAFTLLGKIVDWVWKNVLKPLVEFILANIVPAFSLALDILIFVIDIFSKVAAVVLGIVMPVLNALWTVFTTVFEGIKKAVEFVWNNILYPIFKALYDFINGFVIPMIKNLKLIFETVFAAVRKAVEEAWAKIMLAIKPVIDWINNNIMPVINKVKDQFIKAFETVKTTVATIWEGIKGIVKNGINGVIDFLNGMINSVNNLIDKVNDAGGSIPGFSPITFRIGKIPKLATGGVITSPTLAALGEQSYREAVVPLDRNTGWAEKVAELLTDAGGNRGGAQTIVVRIGEDKIYERVIDYINDQSVASGMTVLNI